MNSEFYFVKTGIANSMKSGIIVFFLMFNFTILSAQVQREYGGIVRGDVSGKKLSLVFTGHEYAEGADFILESLKKGNIKASFFLTGDFLRNPEFEMLVMRMVEDRHYVGPHSDKHLLYASWEDREELLIDKNTFLKDLKHNIDAIELFGIPRSEITFFLPPYEWYNDSISKWTTESGLELINFSSGTRSHADYTDPSMPNYISSRDILRGIMDYEKSSSTGMNGFILLVHLGVGEKREDKFYYFLPELIQFLRDKEYTMVDLEEMLKE